jgi:hypothetical protein
VLQVLGDEAVSAHAFEHNLRNRSRVHEGCHAPAQIVHGDCTARSARKRVADLAAPFQIGAALNYALRGRPRLDSETVATALDSSRGGRFAIVNVWRPISDSPVACEPLACCDAATVDLATDVSVLRVRNTECTENLLGRASVRHRWY